MDKISIIIPIYNVEKYLDKCIESVVNQTYKNLEIILVDDGSPDNCPKICDEWSKNDNRIKVIHKKNGGLSDARNFGLNEASGDYVGFVDSDDIISSNMYEKMLDLMKKNDADICSCEFVRFLEGDKPYFKEDNEYKIYSNDEILKSLLTEKITNHVCNKLFKISLFNNIKFPVGKKYEDIMVMYKILLKTEKFIASKSQYYGYMYRDNSITCGCSRGSIEDYINSINTRYKDLIEEKEELREYLTISKMRMGYIYHLKAVIAKDKSLFFSELLNDEYYFLKQSLTKRAFKQYLKGDNFKTKVLKTLLVLNKNIFWTIENKGRNSND